MVYVFRFHFVYLPLYISPTILPPLLHPTLSPYTFPISHAHKEKIKTKNEMVTGWALSCSHFLFTIFQMVKIFYLLEYHFIIMNLWAMTSLGLHFDCQFQIWGIVNFHYPFQLMLKIELNEYTIQQQQQEQQQSLIPLSGVGCINPRKPLQK